MCKGGDFQVGKSVKSQNSKIGFSTTNFVRKRFQSAETTKAVTLQAQTETIEKRRSSLPLMGRI